MAWNLPQSFHEHVSDSTGPRGYHVPPQTAGASHFALLDFNVLFDLQTGSLAERAQSVDSPVCGMLVWRSCAAY
jgi:hypothetical protein